MNSSSLPPDLFAMRLWSLAPEQIPSLEDAERQIKVMEDSLEKRRTRGPKIFLNAAHCQEKRGLPYEIFPDGQVHMYLHNPAA